MAVRHLRISLVAAVLLLNAGVVSAATDRGQNWEGTIQLIGNGSDSSSGEMGSGLDVDSEVGFAFGLGYNLNSRFALKFDLSFIKPKYTATFNTEESGLVELSHKMSVVNGQFSGVWNIIDGPFTPYVEAGLGWTSVDSNVTDGPPTTGCWWDPWWGYVCRSFYSTYNDTSFSYGGGVGLRYEFSNRMFLKGSVNRYQLDSSGATSDPRLDMWRLELGTMF